MFDGNRRQLVIFDVDVFYAPRRRRYANIVRPRPVNTRVTNRYFRSPFSSRTLRLPNLTRTRSAKVSPWRVFFFLGLRRYSVSRFSHKWTRSPESYVFGKPLRKKTPPIVADTRTHAPGVGFCFLFSLFSGAFALLGADNNSYYPYVIMVLLRK